MSAVNDRIGIVILAAGTSARMGSPKQLLIYKGKGLLNHAIDQGLDTDAGIVIVVLGAYAESILHEIDESRVVVVVNKEWQKGMACSLKLGLTVLLRKKAQLDGVIFMVCDQPSISSDILNSLINTYKKTGKPIVASNYGNATGSPAFFHHSFFEELMQLEGDEGARKIIQQQTDKVATVLFPEGFIDIDRKEDYESLLKD